MMKFIIGFLLQGSNLFKELRGARTEVRQFFFFLGIFVFVFVLWIKAKAQYRSILVGLLLLEEK